MPAPLVWDGFSAMVTTSGGDLNQATVSLSHSATGSVQNDFTVRGDGSGELGPLSDSDIVITVRPQCVYLKDQLPVEQEVITARSNGERVGGVPLEVTWSLVAREGGTASPTNLRKSFQLVTGPDGRAVMEQRPLGFAAYFVGHISVAGSASLPGSTASQTDFDVPEENVTRRGGPPESPPPQGEEDGKELCQGLSPKDAPKSLDGSVGEEKLDIDDLVIPGRGMDYELRRFYQSFDYRKELGIKDFGVAWRYSYVDEYLVKDGTGPDDAANYVNFRVGPGYAFVNTGPGQWVPDIEHFVQLRRNPFTGDLEIREEDGTLRVYHNFSDPSPVNRNGRLKEIRDRNDNRLTLHYERIDPDGVANNGDEKFVLAFAIDTLGREIRYQYYAATNQTVNGRQVTIVTANAAAWGRLARVRDFKGNMDFDAVDEPDVPGQVNNRTLVYDYDGEGNLVRASSPAIAATPTGNNFGAGKTTRYDYITHANRGGLTQPEWDALTPAEKDQLLHKLTHIWYPNEVRDAAGVNPPTAEAAEVVTYQTDPTRPLFGYVTSHTVGGTNANGVPSGGTVTYSYTDLNPTRELPVFGPDLLLDVEDRNGNRARYTWAYGPVLWEYREFPAGLRDGEPAEYLMATDYNKDRLLRTRWSPFGDLTQYTFNETSPDRFQQSNLLRVVQTPAPGREGDQPKIEQVFVYEPIYNRPCLVVYPRGADMDNNGFTPPVGDPAGRTMPDPYDPTKRINLRYVRVEFFDFQESKEEAAQAPDSRRDIDGSNGRVNQSPLIAVDPNVLTTEVWLVQELGLPEDAAGLAELRSRLSANLTRLGLGDLNGDNDTTPAFAGNIVRTVLGSPVLLAGSNQHKLETDIETAGDLINEALPYDQGGTAEGAHGNRLQTIVTMYQYNQFGQMTKVISPEGNVTNHDYFPENNPDGDSNLTPAPADGRSLTTAPGGYLKKTVEDAPRSYFDQSGNPSTGAFSNNNTNPAVTNITVSFTYDDVGNTVTMTNGRGIRTDFFVNEYNEMVQATRAADISAVATADPSDPLFNHPDANVRLTAFGYLSRTFFDYSSNVVLSQVEDRGNTSNVDGSGLGTLPGQALATTPGLAAADPAGGVAFVDMLHIYDRINNPIETRVEVDATGSLNTRYRYDSNQNLVLTIYPEGNADSSVYDERDLLFQSISGATVRPAAGRYAPGDPTTFDRPGGAGTQPSTTTYNYNLNRNLVEIVDAEDTDGDPSNNSLIAGFGDVTRFTYDGYDRRKTVTDPLGNQTIYVYDPDSNVVRVIQNGDAIDDVVGDEENKTLAVTEYIYDELSRVIVTHQVLFQTPDATPARTPVLTDTPAMDALAVYLADASNDMASVPSEIGITVLGRVTTLTEYDRDSRVTFTVQDDLDVYRTDYDGASRVIKTTDSSQSNGFSGGAFNPNNIAGNKVEMAYDDNSNPIEHKETDVTLMPGVVDEVFRTTYLYDSLDRLQTIADNRGQTEDYRYDSRTNLVARADAVGPVTTRTINRRGLGSTASVIVNGFGNVTRTFYDGISRTLQTEAMLTPSGQGSGSYLGATLEGVKVAPPPGYLDPSQSEDGLITVHYAFDDNSQLLALRDDDGNTTAYIYDNQNRTRVERKGLYIGFQGTMFTISGGDSGAFREVRKPPTLVDPPVIKPSTDITYTYDRDSNVVKIVDEAGNIFDCTFDALNRKKSCIITRALGFIGTTGLTFLFDGLSRLTGTFDNNDPDSVHVVTVAVLYDSLSRKVEEQQLIGPLPGIPKMISCSFDIAASGAVWQPSACIYPDGRQVDSFYDALDRLVRRRDNGQATDIGGFEYIGTWRVLTLTYQNNTRLVRTYDDLRRVLTHRWESFTPSTPPGAGTVIVGFGHRDGDGNPAYDRANNKLIEEKLHDPGNSEVYTYDSVYRLKTFDRGTLNAAKTAIATPTVTPAALQAQNWNLDGLGNWTANTHTTGGVPGTENRTHSDFNEIVTLTGAPYDANVPGTYQHDKNGNLTDDGARTYQWDALNRLRKVSRKTDGQPIAEYTYDSNNRRLRKVVTNGGLDGMTPNGTTDFYYDGWRLVEEHDGADTIIQQYVYGNYLDEALTLDNRRDGITVAQLNDGTGNQRHFYHTNTLYHVYGLTDETGAIKEAYQYDAYGYQTVITDGDDLDTIVNFNTNDVRTVNVGSTINNPYMYTEQRFDAETKLMYYKNRYYSQGLGRFLSRDPVGYGDALNLYNYAGSRPTAATDPLGTAEFKVTAIAQWRGTSTRFLGAEPPVFEEQTSTESWWVEHTVRIVCDNGKLLEAVPRLERPSFTGVLLSEFSGGVPRTPDRSFYDESSTYTGPLTLGTVLYPTKNCPGGAEGVVVRVDGTFADLNEPGRWTFSGGPPTHIPGFPVAARVGYSPPNNKFHRGSKAEYEAQYRICCCCSNDYSAEEIEVTKKEAKGRWFRMDLYSPSLGVCPITEHLRRTFPPGK